MISCWAFKRTASTSTVESHEMSPVTRWCHTVVPIPPSLLRSGTDYSGGSKSTRSALRSLSCWNCVACVWNAHATTNDSFYHNHQHTTTNQYHDTYPIQQYVNHHHHHFWHAATNVDISLQSGRFWAMLITWFRERLMDFGSCWIVFIHIVRWLPGGFLQFSSC